MVDVVVPGPRDVRGTLEAPDATPGPEIDRDRSDAAALESIVVAAPPHPERGGTRSDPRLRAVSEALAARGIACLRFDYGPWDEGHGEREDVRTAVRWAADRAESVGVFGYSFGASLALLAVGRDGLERSVAGVAALAPTAALAPDLDAVDALERLECPALVCYGTRDETVEWEPLVERARALDHEAAAFSADHFFLGTRDDVAERVAAFFEARFA